ncbi:hypothetical protein DTO012A7_5040 [Penicillium roqueforti]|nr:hypothetical protein CBS147326_1902 [Penicillium roqueforti]KAI3154443.1 hypothetical protein CBS147325_1535 [Penicillium roqueforti]KAI3154590.1 hypothetical protein DTO046C5_8579 [Penicillium roqueforti]KAI3232783.1 hypothetical protein DTO012A7_5040 [Penicillium roqueforti]
MDSWETGVRTPRDRADFYYTIGTKTAKIEAFGGQNSVTRLGNRQCFTFSAQDDRWKYSWTGRTGIPLAHFECRWKQMKPYPYTGPEDIRALRNQDPGNATFTVSDPNKVGGVRTTRDSEIIENITALIAQYRIKEMARMFHATYRGDWNRGRAVA